MLLTAQIADHSTGITWSTLTAVTRLSGPWLCHDQDHSCVMELWCVWQASRI